MVAAQQKPGPLSRLTVIEMAGLGPVPHAGLMLAEMGASVLRNKFKKAGVEGVTVTNQAIANLDGTADLVITQQQLTERAQSKSPNSIHVSVDNFMNAPQYEEVVEMVRAQRGTDA